jgi:uncharacterized protein YgbK (DUF1537 family)
MARHAVTPMDESDLRRHLGQQTKAGIALFDLLHLSGTDELVDERFAALLANRPEIVLFDALDDERLRRAGRLIWQSDVSFVIGSSGVGYALTGHWGRPRAEYPPAGTVEQLIVLSGSCSAATAGQIEWAEANGYAGLRLDASRLVDDATAAAERERLRLVALEMLASGRSLVLYSARGPHDPEMRASNERLRQAGMDDLKVRERLASQQGRLLRDLLLASGVRRVCVAGGDTSSFAISQLGIYALELRRPLVPGQPLNRAYADDDRLDGLEIALKGGQHGRADHFESVRRGTLL